MSLIYISHSRIWGLAKNTLLKSTNQCILKNQCYVECLTQGHAISNCKVGLFQYKLKIIFLLCMQLCFLFPEKVHLNPTVQF